MSIFEGVVPTVTIPSSSWGPVDVGPYLDGTYSPPVPTLLRRSDGRHLLYPGRVHSFHGESESGKSLVAQAACADVLTSGGVVLYVDFEDGPDGVIPRLMQMGASADDIRDRLCYIRPLDGLSDPQAQEDFENTLADLVTCDLAIVDGVTEGTSLVTSVMDGLEERVIKFGDRVPSRIARETGAAVVVIDHVAKSSERGRFAIGSQHKMARLDGAAYTVEVVEPLGDGLRGVVELRVAKDRPGQVRPHSGPMRKADRTQLAATVVVDSRLPNVIDVTLYGPEDAAGGPTTFRPTHMMKLASQTLAGVDGGLTQNTLLANIPGKRTAATAAVRLLVEEGYARTTSGPRNSLVYWHVKPFEDGNQLAPVSEWGTP